MNYLRNKVVKNEVEKPRPKIGTGVFVLNDKGQVLFLLRRGSHGADSWCLPGGHLEFGESFLQNAQRETKEETDLDVSDVEVVGVTNDLYENEHKHYVTIFMKAKRWSGTPKIMEPEKCAKTEWFELTHLPNPMFLSDENFFKGNPVCLCGSGEKWNKCHGK